MRNITAEEVRSYWMSLTLNKEGLGVGQVRRKLEREEALDSLRNASSIAHLKPILQFILERLHD